MGCFCLTSTLSLPSSNYVQPLPPCLEDLSASLFYLCEWKYTHIALPSGILYTTAHITVTGDHFSSAMLFLDVLGCGEEHS